MGWKVSFRPSPLGVKLLGIYTLKSGVTVMDFTMVSEHWLLSHTIMATAYVPALSKFMVGFSQLITAPLLSTKCQLQRCCPAPLLVLTKCTSSTFSTGVFGSQVKSALGGASTVTAKVCVLLQPV